MRVWHFIRSTTSQPQKPLNIMRCRFFYVSFLVLSMDAVYAETAAWNCNQSPDGKQWGCSGINVLDTENTVKTTESNTTAPASPAAPARVPTPEKPALNAATPVNNPDSEIDIPALPPKAAADSNTKAAAADTKTPACCDNVTNAASNDSNFRILEPAFSQQQEQIFTRLQSRLRANPWGNCATSFNAPNPFANLTADKQLRETAPMDIDSDYSEIFEKETYNFRGNVKIKRADQNVLADQMSLNTLSNSVDAQGKVYYSENELSMFSDSVLLNLTNDQARLRDTLFISPGAPIRGKAGTVYQESKDFSHFKDVTYTSCPPGNQDWAIHAERLKINKAVGKGAAKDAWLEFKGVPVFYTPFISFPLDNRRITGFLAPHWGSSGQNGVDFSAPFYWNMAPNYDLLFRPRYLAKRGVMLGADFRYMNSFSRSKLGIDVLPYDDKRNNQTRYRGSFQNQTLLSTHTNTNIDLNYVSDKKYISELGNALSLTDIRHVRSVADLNYNREGVSFLTRMENFQTIDQSLAPNQRPYRKLPQVTLNLNHSFNNLPTPVDVGLDNEFVVFNHSHTVDDEFGYRNVDGQRFNIKPYVSLPFKTAGGFAIPKFSVLHTDYLLNNQFAGKPSNISRTLPIASFDAGLFAEGSLNFNNTHYTHTLEPRLFYVYIPYTDQRAQPVFDTAVYDFNFDSLFRENRFTGVDRVQDTNQVTIALTQRLMDASTGREKLKFSLGDIIYLQSRHAMLDAIDPNGFASQSFYNRSLLQQNNHNTFSNVVAELSGQITNNLSFSSGLQWDPYKYDLPCTQDGSNPGCFKAAKDIPRTQIALHYRSEPNQIVNLGYRYRQDLISTGDVSFRWPLLANWFAVGRWQYSLLYDKTTESFLGLEKENCCWRFRIIGRRYINGLNVTDVGTQGAALNQQLVANSESQTAVIFQIELKSLSAFGDNVDAFLQKNIYGYLK